MDTALRRILTETVPGATGSIRSLAGLGIAMTATGTLQLDAAKFATGAKERVTQGACNRPETREDLLRQGVILRYAYVDKDKQHIATIDVLPADCDS